MIGPFDKPAELRIQPLPFELMFQMAEKRQQRADKTEEVAGALSGAFASLQSAPGHEGYKVETLKPYQDALQQFMKKYSDMSDPRALRELINIKSAFQNDPNIHNIVESKQTYDKLLPEMYKAKNTGAVFTGSIFDREGNIQENRQRYTPEQLSFIPQADINPEIDAQLAKVHPHITQGNFLPKISYMKGPNGEDVPMIQQGQTITERKSYEEFNKAIEAITESIMQGNTDGSRYYIAKNGTGDYASTREIVRQQVLRNAIPFFYQNTKTDSSHSQFAGKDNEDTGSSIEQINIVYDQTNNASSLSSDVKSKRTNINTTISDLGVINPGIGGTNIRNTPQNIPAEKVYYTLTRLNQFKAKHFANLLGLNTDPGKWTDSDWNKITELSDKIDSGIKTTTVQNFQRNSTIREENGKAMNSKKGSYVFYNPETKQIITGYQLGKDGFSIKEETGWLSSSNLIPYNIPGQTKYTFASPRTVIAKNKDGQEIELYAGINRAEINDEYLVGLLSNRISNALERNVPQPITEYNSDVVIIPGKNPYSFSLNIKGNNIDFTYDNIQSYKEGIINLLNDPNIENSLLDALFEQK